MFFEEDVLILFRIFPWYTTRELPFLMAVESLGPHRRSVDC